MSDHEGDVVDNWEEASLAPTGSISFRGVDSLTKPIIPRATANETIDAIKGPRPQRNNYARNVPSNYRPGIQSSMGIKSRQRGGVQSRAVPKIPPPEPVRNQAYIDFQSGAAPCGEHELSVAWKTILSNIPADSAIRNPAAKARFHLDDVGQKSNTYVATPELDASKLQIWGSDEDVKQAKSHLSVLEAYIRSTGIRPHRGKWTRERAFDGRVDSRLEMADLRKEQFEASRLQVLSTNFPFESYLLWAKDENMAEFRLRYQRVLDDLQKEFECKIDLVEGGVSANGIKHVKIGAQGEETVWKVHQRILNIIKEYLASTANFLRMNFFRLPTADSYRDKITCHKDPASGKFLPTMWDKPLPGNEVEKWNNLCHNYRDLDRKDIRSAIDSSITSLHAAEKHVQMRVTFSELGFSQVKQPTGYPEQDYHEFDDFCSMFSEPLIRLESNGLRAPQGCDLSGLANILESMPEFGQPEICFILQFDIRGVNQTLLRLEKEYKVAINGHDTEACATRWLEFSRDFDKDTVLEISVLDLEHPGANYQIQMRATNIYRPNPNREPEKHQFQHSVSFKAPRNGIKAPPRRRAVFQGPPGLETFEEIYLIRYPFRDTDGTLELRRTDVYTEAPTQKSVTPTRSAWNAFYYYHEWDALMGQFGDVKPGHQVSWSRSFGSFFRNARNDGDYRPLPRSFKAFMNEVEEIQGLLSKAINNLPRAPTPSSANGMAVG